MKKEDILAIIDDCIKSTVNMNNYVIYNYTEEQITELQKIGEKLAKDKETVKKGKYKETTIENKYKLYSEIKKLIDEELLRQKTNYYNLSSKQIINNVEKTSDIKEKLRKNITNSKLNKKEQEIVNNDNRINDAIVLSSTLSEEDIKKLNSSVKNDIYALRTAVAKCNKVDSFKVEIQNYDLTDEENERINAYIDQMKKKLKVDAKKVVEVKKEQAEKKNISTRKVLKNFGIALLVIALLGGATYHLFNHKDKNNMNKNKNDKTPDETKQEESYTNISELNINKIDLNNDAQLTAYALFVQTELANNGCTLSVDEIINAIRLANFNYDDEEKPFESTDEAFKATLDSGKIYSKLGSSSIIHYDYQNDYLVDENIIIDMLNNVTDGYIKLSDLKLNKTNEKYNLYSLVDSTLNIMKNANNEYTSDQRIDAANLYDEIMTRKFRSKTLTEESNSGQLYTLAGLFNETKPLNDLLYDGASNVYGNTGYVDGTYGTNCYGSLINYLMIEKANEGYRYNVGTAMYDTINVTVNNGLSK